MYERASTGAVELSFARSQTKTRQEDGELCEEDKVCWARIRLGRKATDQQFVEKVLAVPW